MARRVLLVTQWFDPEPAFKGLLFAKELVKRGFDVEVLTGFPNYPGGKLYPGYRLRFFMREEIEGVRISRVPLYPSHDRSAWRRVINYVSFAVSATVFGGFFARRFDVIYAYHPPLTVGLAASVIALLRRRPMVYDIQDLWPDTLAVTGMITNSRLLRVVDRCCRWVYSRASHIAVLSPGFKTRLIAKGVPSEKVSVIYNWADEHSLRSGTAAADQVCDTRRAGELIILFAGNMGRAQGLESVLDAAMILQREATPVRFHFIGGGLEVDRLKLHALEMRLTNVEFFDPVPMSEIGQVIAGSDVLLVHLRSDPLFEITIPSKTQAYLCAGKPILMAVRGDAANLVLEADAGVLAEPGDPESIAHAVRRLAALSAPRRRELGENGSRFYREHLSLSSGVDKFAALFTNLSAHRRQIDCD